MSVHELFGNACLTPKGTSASVKFEEAIMKAIEEAEDEGLCWGMIVAVLVQNTYWMNKRVDECE